MSIEEWRFARVQRLGLAHGLVHCSRDSLINVSSGLGFGDCDLFEIWGFGSWDLPEISDFVLGICGLGSCDLPARKPWGDHLRNGYAKPWRNVPATPENG